MNLEMLKYSLLLIIFVIQGKAEQCPLGTYGEVCDQNCSSHCDKNVHCHKLTGKCSERCIRGWHGDQCNLRCSRNCLNHVCNVQTGTCIRCKANYSGDYCETYEQSGPQECVHLAGECISSTTMAAILVPVLFISTIINIGLIVYIRRTRSKGGKKKVSDDEDVDKRLMSEDPNNTAGKVIPATTQNTGLHVACKEGKLQSVREILDESLEDVNRHGKDGMTPVMWAASRGHREILDLLVKKGADLQLGDVVNNNSLHWACYGGDVSMVKHIISLNAVDINSKGRDGRTPLMYAARKGENTIFRLLVSKGGLPSDEDNDGNSILLIACWGGNVKIVEYILSHNTADINSRGQSGRTPLMVAAYKGHGDIFDLLLNKGADFSVADHAGDNVLHEACPGGYVDIVSRVLKLNKVNINSRGQCHRTPLMMAARTGDKEIFDLLLKEGADITPVDADCNTILHLASEGGNIDIVKYALGVKNVDINDRNNRRETPAMLATNGGDVSDLLVKRGGHVS